MKKIAIVLAFVLLVSVGLVGCKKDGKNSANDLVGTWKLTSMEYAGQKIEGEELAAYGDAMTIEFKSDGKVSLMGDESTYSQSDNKVEISNEGEVIITLVKDGNTLVVDEDGMKMVFTK